MSDVKTMQAMHHFTIHTRSGSLLGFLVMMPDETEEGEQPQSGRFALRPHAEIKHESGTVLYRLAQEVRPLHWRVENGRAELFCGGHNVGFVSGEYLRLAGYMLTLVDLEGAV